MAAGNGAMYGAVVSGCISRFTSKKQRVLNRSTQGLLRGLRAYFAVAVGSARKRIILPIMKIDFLQPALEALQIQSQHIRQCSRALLNNGRATKRSQSLR